MPATRRLGLAAASLLMLAPLGGCLTPHSKPELSKAVAESRMRRSAPAAPGCPQTPLSEVSPVTVAFAFDEATLPDLKDHPLVAAAKWLDCSGATPVVVKPDADVHGTDAEQDALARRRAVAVQAYLVSQGVAAGRIQILARGATEPAGEHLLVLAEGRRW